MTDWTQCRRCGLREFRRHVVLMRGAIPADVLFIGEAPGEVEDARGIPFIGPSGKLLDSIIFAAECFAGVENNALKYAITNTVACRPCDGKGMPNRAPTKTEVVECRARLQNEVSMARAFRVVLVGAVARDSCEGMFPKGVRLEIPHPAFILRNGGGASPMFMRTARDLSVLLKEVANEKDREESRVRGTAHRRSNTKPAKCVVRLSRAGKVHHRRLEKKGSQR